MDFYSCKTLAADTEYYMQLGSKKNIWKLQKLTLSQKIFSCKQYPAVEAENQRSEKCAKNINKYVSDTQCQPVAVPGWASR